MKFKVGDIVRCKKDTYKYGPEIYAYSFIVDTVSINSEFMYIKKNNNHDSLLHRAYINDFELVEEPKTNIGSRYNSGKLRWRNFPMFLLRPVVEVGAAAEKIEGNPTGKYPTYNFLQGLSVADCMDCLKRHLDAVDDPSQPDIDPEDGKHHLAKVAWNALVALHYINTRPDLDDRFKGESND